MTTTTDRRETDDEREERERLEAEQARAARIVALAAMTDDQLVSEASDDDLHALTAHLATVRTPSTRGVLTVPRAEGHQRLESAREGLAGAAAAAIVAAGRGAGKPDGPGVEDLRRAHALHQLAGAPDGFWKALHDVVDGPAPAGMSELFSDTDERAEIRAAQDAIERRRSLISAELEAREVARRAAAHPGMAQRIAKLVKGDGK